MIRNKTARVAAVTAILALGAPLAAADEEPSGGEKELARILEGRVAGEPVDCLRAHQSDRLQVVDETALVFRDGKTIYVNRPRGAEMLDQSDLPVIRQWGSQLCRLDRVEMRDRIGGIPGPLLVLEDFVPYTKANTGG